MEENTLRAILLIVGVIILLGIYFTDKIKKRPKQVFDEVVEPPETSAFSAVVAEKIQPTIANESFVAEAVNVAQPYIDNEVPASFEETKEVPVVEDVIVVEAPREKPVAPVIDIPSPEEGRQEHEDIPVVEQAPLIQLAVMSRHGTAMEGVELLNAFTELGLAFGDMGIFHYYQRQPDNEQQLFHIANMVEPGAFPVGSMSDFETNGVLLFMQAGTADDSLLAFEQMLETGRRLSEQFNADLLDAKKEILSIDKITEIQQQLSYLAHS